MKHVFVETNWVVDWAAPAHLRDPSALELAERGARGELVLHVPAFCVAEARPPIRTLHPRNADDVVGRFLPWATKAGYITAESAMAVRQVLGEMASRVNNDLATLDRRLSMLRGLDGVDVFPLDQEMLEFGFELADTDLGQLQPIDKTVLSAILVRVRQLIAAGESDFVFCEKDHHLQPWDKNGKAKPTSTSLFDEHRIRVYRDWTLTTPEPYEGWPPAPKTARRRK